MSDDVELPDVVGGFDVAVLALHGAAGEDGTIQSVLELLHLPHLLRSLMPPFRNARTGL